MRFGFLEGHRGEIGPIKKACGLMKVSKSGFYEHLGRKKSNAQIGREALEGFVVEAFERHKGRCGHRRINRELRKSGIAMSEKRVPHIMRKPGLAGRGATRKRRIQKKAEPGGPSVEPGRARFRRGRAQRASGGRHRMHAHERRAALSRGRDRRLLPQGRGLVDVRAHHREDRDRRDRAGGWQGGPARRRQPRLPWRPRRAAHFALLPTMPGIVQSASRPSTPPDNAAAEPFFETPKGESVEGRSHGTRDEAKQGIFKHIGPYCNGVRMLPPWATCLQRNTSDNTLEDP